jgi:hypothetical protein
LQRLRCAGYRWRWILKFDWKLVKYGLNCWYCVDWAKAGCFMGDPYASGDTCIVVKENSYLILEKMSILNNNVTFLSAFVLCSLSHYFDKFEYFQFEI